MNGKKAGFQQVIKIPLLVMNKPAVPFSVNLVPYNMEYGVIFSFRQYYIVLIAQNDVFGFKIGVGLYKGFYGLIEIYRIEF